MSDAPWHRLGLTLDAWERLPLDVRIPLAAVPYLGFRYSLTSPRVAYPSGAVPSSLVGGDAVTNCSTFTASLLGAVYPGAPWSAREYGDLQCFADRFPGDGDSPIEAVERLGIGRRVQGMDPDGWYLVQGWCSSTPPTGGGHAFLVRTFGNAIEVLEASGTRQGGIGPRMVTRPRDYVSSRYAVAYYARLL